MLLGYFDEKFLGRVNECELRLPDRFPWETLNGPQLGNLEGFLVRKYDGEAIG